MSIPSFYAVDFSPCRRDFIQRGLQRLLDQHYGRPMLAAFISALLSEVQTLYDALLDLQEGRTLYRAEGENLDALGRIVGEARTPWQYDETGWMFADRPSQAADGAAAWCMGAAFEAFLPVDDARYRLNILARIIKNHTLTASIPELERLTWLLTGERISYEKTGPMQVRTLAPSTLSSAALALLTRARNSARADDVFALPYPATLWFDGLMTYVPGPFFCADRAPEFSQQCDRAGCAVGVPYNPGVYHVD